jgi:hypothetical protein
MALTPQHISVEIGELVLHGFAAADRYRIGDAIERELARLLVERGLPEALRRSVASGRVTAPPISVRRGASALRTGTDVARAVYASLARAGGGAP